MRGGGEKREERREKREGRGEKSRWCENPFSHPSPQESLPANLREALSSRITKTLRPSREALPTANRATRSCYCLRDQWRRERIPKTDGARKDSRTSSLLLSSLLALRSSLLIPSPPVAKRVFTTYTLPVIRCWADRDGRGRAGPPPHQARTGVCRQAPVHRQSSSLTGERGALPSPIRFRPVNGGRRRSIKDGAPG